MNPNETKRIEMTPEQAKAFAAELREQARLIEGYADMVASSPNPDSYTYVAIAKCVPVRIRIGKEQGMPTASAPAWLGLGVVVGAPVRVSDIGQGTWEGTLVQVGPRTCRVKSNHTGSVIRVTKSRVTVLDV